MKKRFGSFVLQKRLAKGITLRKFAGIMGVSPTYLAQIEQGNCDPPMASRVRRMAEILSENVDELTALAGRVRVDLPAIIQRHPASIAEFLREASGLSPDEL